MYKTLHAISLIKKYFTVDELLNIITSQFYSRLCYGASVWLNKCLNQKSRNRLYALSGKALKLVIGDDYSLFSYNDLHNMFNRATPDQWSKYKSVLMIYNLINNGKPKATYDSLMSNMVTNTRSGKFDFIPNNTRMSGRNSFKNRLSGLTRDIRISNMKLGVIAFKTKLKRLFII